MIHLNDICDLVAASVDPRNHAEELYLGLEHIPSGRFHRIQGGKASDVVSSKTAFKKGDILYGKLRPYLDKAIIADDGGVCTTELLVLRPKKGIDPRFLIGVVHSIDFIDFSVSGTTGSQHPRTSWHHIKNFELPEFDKHAQTSIGILASLVQDALVVCEKAIEIEMQLKRSAMQTLFTRGLRGEAQKETEIGLVPESWTIVDFASVRVWLQYGTSIKCSEQVKEYPVLRIPNIDFGSIQNKNLKYCTMEKAEAEKYLLEKGDLLFIRSNGVADRLGSCAVFMGEPKNALFASYLIRARIKSEIILPTFIAYFLNSEKGTSLVAGRATPAADGKFNLNTSTIDSIPIPLSPNIDEQLGIVQIIESIDKKINLHKRKQIVLEALFKSMLHKLMTGEIRVSDLDLSAIESEVTQ